MMKKPNIRAALAKHCMRLMILTAVLVSIFVFRAILDAAIVVQVEIDLLILAGLAGLAIGVSGLELAYNLSVRTFWQELHQHFVRHRTQGPVQPSKQSEGVYAVEFGGEERWLASGFEKIITTMLSVLLALGLLFARNDWPLFSIACGLVLFAIIGYYVGRKLTQMADVAKTAIAKRVKLTNAAQSALGSVAGRQSLQDQTELVEDVVWRTEGLVLRHDRWNMVYSWFTGETHYFMILGLLVAVMIGAVDQAQALTASTILVVVGARFVIVMRSISNFNSMFNAVRRLYDNLIPGPYVEERAPLPMAKNAVDSVLGQGGIAFIMGRSGIGKSTSLKALAAKEGRITNIDQHIIELWDDLDSMLDEYEAHDLSRKGVLVLDELFNTFEDEKIASLVERLEQAAVDAVIVLHDADMRWPAGRYPIFNLED